MTTSTLGRSSPRAATSVARRMAGDEGVESADEKAARVRVRAAGGRWPCNEYNSDDGGRTDGRTCDTRSIRRLYEYIYQSNSTHPIEIVDAGTGREVNDKL